MRWIVPLLIALVAGACSPSNALVPSTSTTSTTVETTTTTTSTVAEAATTNMVVETTTPEPFRLTSPAFEDAGLIPVDHTCDGSDVSPPLEVTGLPSSTESVVIQVEDPDTAVGNWVHWLVFDVAVQPSELTLPAGVDDRGTSGVNSWKITGYKGPCPPEGEEHQYFFTVYALSDTLELPEGVEPAVVQEAMQPLLISSAELMGRYAR